MKKSFGSDNHSGIHPTILGALVQANIGHTPSYGNDPYTQEAIALLKHHFGAECDPYLVNTGTAANVLGLDTLLQSYQAIIATDVAHINTDECGALEQYTGCKLLTVPSINGKLTRERITHFMVNVENQHRVQPKVISLTQATEFGTVYTIPEIKEITAFAHLNNMLVHMDGARLSNASAYLNCSFADMTTNAGVDLVTFGGTKNGLMMGEAVIFANKALSKDFKYIRKQGMQLVSKMRFISAQFVALLSNNLWLTNAQHANAMAALLAELIQDIPEIKINRPVQTNSVFANVPKEIIVPLQEQYYFYVWDHPTNEVRWMCSFDTTEQDIYAFVSCIKEIVAKRAVK